ncbi:MAG: hypothetical protein AAGI03_12335, partial [Pseudomonadota bacterium]
MAKTCADFLRRFKGRHTAEGIGEAVLFAGVTAKAVDGQNKRDYPTPQAQLLTIRSMSQPLNPLPPPETIIVDSKRVSCDG